MLQPVGMSILAINLQLCVLAGTAGAADWNGVNHWLSDLSSESAVVRQHAIDSLQSMAASLSANERSQLERQIRSRALVDSLDLQIVCEQLISQIEADIKQIELARWTRQRRAHRDPQVANQALSLPLLKQYHALSRIAGDNLDTVETFAAAASSSDSRFRFINQFARFAFMRPRLYDPQTAQWHRELSAISESEVGATAVRRVQGRLVDAVVLDNRFGWDWETRLRIAMVHGRSEAALQMCSEVLDDTHAAPLSIAIAMLCESRLGGQSLDRHITAYRDDQRTIAIPPSAWNLRREGAKWIPPSRVQDVVLMICLEQHDVDPRTLGMRGLMADPAWGTRVESIWFADASLRDQASQLIFASVASHESDVAADPAGRFETLDSSRDGT